MCPIGCCSQQFTSCAELVVHLLVTHLYTSPDSCRQFGINRIVAQKYLKFVGTRFTVLKLYHDIEKAKANRYNQPCEDGVLDLDRLKAMPNRKNIYNQNCPE